MPPKFKRNIQCILLKNIYKTTRTHTYGTITLYGATIPSQLQLSPRGLKIYLKHHISTYLTVRDSVCPTSFSLAVTNDIAYCFLFLHLLRCFNSVGSQSSTDQTQKCLGSPIRQSWDQRMSAPTPSLTQLTTTFIGNSSQAIPQIAQVAIFSYKNIKKYSNYINLVKIIVNTTKRKIPVSNIT